MNPIGVRSCYDEGKRCAGTLFHAYWLQCNLLIKIVRIFNTYGPRMHPNDGRVVSNFILQALQNRDITIYGDGQQTRSFCYRDDLIEAMIRMMDTPDEMCIRDRFEIDFRQFQLALQPPDAGSDHLLFPCLLYTSGACIWTAADGDGFRGR